MAYLLCQASSERLSDFWSQFFLTIHTTEISSAVAMKYFVEKWICHYVLFHPGVFGVNIESFVFYELKLHKIVF